MNDLRQFPIEKDIEKEVFLGIVSKKWRFFVLINARANDNIFRVKKSHISITSIFFTHSVAFVFIFSWYHFIHISCDEMKTSKNFLDRKKWKLSKKFQSKYANIYVCKERYLQYTLIVMLIMFLIL